MYQGPITGGKSRAVLAALPYDTLCVSATLQRAQSLSEVIKNHISDVTQTRDREYVREERLFGKLQEAGHTLLPDS